MPGYKDNVSGDRCPELEGLSEAAPDLLTQPGEWIELKDILPSDAEIKCAQCGKYAAGLCEFSLPAPRIVTDKFLAAQGGNENA